jgi:hypothetical protein
MIKVRVWLTRKPQRQAPYQSMRLLVQAATGAPPAPLIHALVELPPEMSVDSLLHEVRSRLAPLALPPVEIDTLLDELTAARQILSAEVGRLSAAPGWTEFCCELVWRQPESAVLSRRRYVGCIFPLLKGAPYQLGAAGESIRAAWEALIVRCAAAMPDHLIGALAPLDLASNAMIMDGHSAAILVHETLGHAGEEDSMIHQYQAPTVEGLQVRDIPAAPWGMDYRVADDGSTGREVLVLPRMCRASLTSATGNLFLGLSADHAAFSVRQRNLVIERTVCPRSAAPNTVLVAGGVNSSTGHVVLRGIALVNAQPVAFTSSFPLSAEIRLRPNDLPTAQNVGVCIKNGATHLFGISSGGIVLELTQAVAVVSKVLSS